MSANPFAIAADLFDPPPPRHATPADIAAELDPRFRRPVHIDRLAAAIARTVDVGGRLIVQAPPRHGKSVTTSQWTPVWYLDRHPDRRVVLASYAATFAATWGRKVRNIAAAHRDQLNLRLSPDSLSRSDWTTTREGGMLTVGVGGPITGRGADLLLVDDPIKNAAEAYSPTIRDSIWDWWTSTARTRLEPDGAIVIVMTRWHHDDLVGRLLAGKDDDHGDKWDVITFPAVAEDDGDQLDRAPGEALWPERYDDAALARLRHSVGPVTWQALYQQKPTTDEGGIFPRAAWRWYDGRQWTEQADGSNRILGHGIVYQSWDMAFKATDGSDYVVGQVWLRRGADDYLLDQRRARMTFTETCQAVRAMKVRWPETGAVLVEDKANGSAVMDTLASTVRGLTPVEPQGGKEARAHAVSPFVHAGNVHIPSPELAPWIDDYVTELALFPAGAHDDQVDATSQALSYEPPDAEGYEYEPDVDFDLM